MTSKLSVDWFRTASVATQLTVVTSGVVAVGEQRPWRRVTGGGDGTREVVGRRERVGDVGSLGLVGEHLEVVGERERRRGGVQLDEGEARGPDDPAGGDRAELDPVPTVLGSAAERHVEGRRRVGLPGGRLVGGPCQNLYCRATPSEPLNVSDVAAEMRVASPPVSAFGPYFGSPIVSVPAVGGAGVVSVTV